MSMQTTHRAVSTLRTGQNQSRIRHVVTQVHMRSPAQDSPSFLQRDVGFDGNGVGSDHRSVGSSLALNFTALCVPERNTQSFAQTSNK